MPYKDPLKRREHQKAYRSARADQLREYNRRYREANRERIRAQRREWSRKNRARRKQYRAASKRQFLLYHAKSRAKRAGIPFDLSADDLYWPERCPVFGFPLDYGADNPFQHNAPTLDRIEPGKGYVRGNVQVISWRANCLKRDATVEELRQLADYMEVMHG